MATRIGPVSRQAMEAAEGRVPRPPELLGSAFATAALLLVVAGAHVVLVGGGVELPVPVLRWIMWPGNELLGFFFAEPRDLFAWLPAASEGLAPVLLDILALVVASVVVYVLPVHGLRQLRYRMRTWRRRRALAADEPEMPEFQVRVAHDPYEDDMKRVLGDD